jgi:hypothetical protein
MPVKKAAKKKPKNSLETFLEEDSNEWN